MLEQSKATLSDAPAGERKVAETIALRFLASELEENLMPPEGAARTAQAHKDAIDEIWLRTVHGILLGLRSAAEQGHDFGTQGSIEKSRSGHFAQHDQISGSKF